MSATVFTHPPSDAPDGPPHTVAWPTSNPWFALTAAGCPEEHAQEIEEQDSTRRANSSAPDLVPHLPLWEQPQLRWLYPTASELKQAFEQGDAVHAGLCQCAPSNGNGNGFAGEVRVWMIHIAASAAALPDGPNSSRRSATWLDITPAAQALVSTSPLWPGGTRGPQVSPMAALLPSGSDHGVWTDPHRFQSVMEMETTASAQIGRGCALLVFRWLSPAMALPGSTALAMRAIEAHLAAARRPSDTLSRTGADEWSVLLTMLGSDAMATAHDMHRMGLQVIESVSLDMAQHASSSSASDAGRLVVGVTLIESHSEAAATALAQAQACLPSWAAPDAPRGVVFANTAIQERIHVHNTLTAELSRAIELSELHLYFQPVVDIHADIVGAEALIRWDNPTHGLIAPSRFIPLAEESGLIIPIGRWILRTACEQLVDWARIPYKAEWTIAVNISAQQFQRPDFASDVLALLLQTGANPRRLKLELTESLMMHDVEGAIATMKTLQTHGIKFSLDDFGTGYSSLSYLKRIPLDQVKIDQSFVRDLHTDANDAAIVKTILALAHSLELAVVAEGVETLEQEEFLVAAGCRYMQGYLYGRPAPIADWD